MRLEQRLTPQLIQSMEILQLNVTDLEQRVAEELEKNVALESNEVELPEVAQITVEPGKPTTEITVEGPTLTESFDSVDRFNREYDVDSDDRGYLSHRRTNQYEDRDAKLDAMANTAARPESLAEHLHQQWILLELDQEVRRAGEAIIYSLDEDGYLRTHLNEVAENTRPALPLADLEAALPQIQQLDPVGVAARDYQECLLIQLEAMPGDNLIERTLIKHHLQEIIRNRYPAIVKATGYSMGEIGEAVKVISTCLHLHPAYLVIERQVPRVRPDIIVEFDEDKSGVLLVRLTWGNMPTLKISTQYAEMLEDKSVERKARTFIRKQVEGASALIDAVTYRRGRMFDVAKCVVERQHEFFYQGPMALQVLRMSELAEELGCDPSTISRTVADKYVQTPRGIYPLRYFFTGGTESADGQSTSWDSVKTRVKELIENEDSAKPYNDDQVAAVLSEEGIDISRRTVAKYRQQLNIPTARQRRKF